jgi:hypothetical protein
MLSREEVLVKVALGAFYEEMEKDAVVNPQTGEIAKGVWQAPGQTITGRRKAPSVGAPVKKPTQQGGFRFGGGLGDAAGDVAGEASRAKTRSALSMALKKSQQSRPAAPRQVASMPPR